MQRGFKYFMGAGNCVKAYFISFDFPQEDIEHMNPFI